MVLSNKSIGEISVQIDYDVCRIVRNISYIHVSSQIWHNRNCPLWILSQKSVYQGFLIL
jgi:hypothetical protein